MPAVTLGGVVKFLFLLLPCYVLVISPLINIVFSPTRVTYQSFEKTDALVLPDPDLECLSHTYLPRILSRQPLVVYLENFVSNAERQAILNLASQNYSLSPVYHSNTESHSPSIRNSTRSKLPRTPDVQCLERRALAFQGFPPDTFIERLWAQKYETGGHYVHHFDWSGDLRGGRGGRVSTFMVYLSCEDCDGGGTGFPRLHLSDKTPWCDVLECADSGEQDGLVFKPIAGNAVYWENFDPSGKGWEELWHSGLPVKAGRKIGLNIWSWYQPGYNGVTPGKMTKDEL